MSFFNIIVKKVCTASSRTINGIAPLTSFYKYVYSGNNEIKVSVHNEVERVKKRNRSATTGELMTAECASVIYFCIYCT
jgi:hypothetical protein